MKRDFSNFTNKTIIKMSTFEIKLLKNIHDLVIKVYDSLSPLIWSENFSSLIPQ